MNETITLFVPFEFEKAVEEVKNAKETLKSAQENSDKIIKNSIVICTSQIATGKGCGAHLHIADLTYIQTHFYIAPHSCTEGDYWKQGEGAFICPACGHRNRLYDSPAVEALKRYFKDYKEEHKN